MITQSNTGHGHVVPRADGVKMRCGGLALCATCQMEKQTLEKSLNPTPPAAQAQGERERERAVHAAFNDWSWNKKGEAVGRMDGQAAAYEGFHAGAEWQARTALSAPPAAGVPDGWKLVPIEPTQAMFEAGRTSATGSSSEKLAMAGYYRSMLAAAPTPPASEQQHDGRMPSDARNRMWGLIDVALLDTVPDGLKRGDICNTLAPLLASEQQQAVVMSQELPALGSLVAFADTLKLKLRDREELWDGAKALYEQLTTATRLSPSEQQMAVEAILSLTDDDGRSAFEAMCREECRDIERDDLLTWKYVNSVTFDRFIGFSSACNRIRNELRRLQPAAPSQGESE